MHITDADRTKLEAYAWPGGYPIIYLATDGWREEDGTLTPLPHDGEHSWLQARCISNIERTLTTMTKLERFLYDNTGGGWEQGRVRGAIQLAIAVHYATDQDWTYEWKVDKIPCSHQHNEDHEAEVCILRGSDGEILSSLCGICGATPEYRRVVEAELALEAMHAHLKEAE